ncbi:TetR/AcrR family transcriptional regulator [Microbacterium sp. ZW T5_45]|uniref:TetR/AcrR family transcriptional regulator n=1 Tax=Microbacterium sp. ZW T5_45 TaxID=3378080 RepID=UPI003854E33A
MPGGRKRGFDDQEALQAAMELFWRRGYEGTSITDLTRTLGINPPSLYAAFGSKRDLFEKALQRYMDDRTAQVEMAMAHPTAHEAMLALLTGRAEIFTEPGQPSGCMTVQAGLTSGDPGHEIAGLLSNARERTRRTVLSRLRDAASDGDLPDDADCTVLARFVMATIDGMSIEAASGAPREELISAATLAAHVIPRRTSPIPDPESRTAALDPSCILQR